VLLKEKHARQKTRAAAAAAKKQTSSRRNDYWLDTFQMRSFEKKNENCGK
jgi:hypothetical protein